VLAAYGRAWKGYLDAYALAMAEDSEPPSPPAALLSGELWAKALDVDPPRVTWAAPLLLSLPPLVPRADVGKRGIVCLISNFSWLDGQSHPVMRKRFLDAFDQIWIDN